MAKNSENLEILYDDVVIDVGALASKDAISVDSKIDSSRLNGFRVMKTEYWISYEGKTTAQGPIMVGYSPTLTAQQVENGIEADPQVSSAVDETAKSKAPIFPLEMIGAEGTAKVEDSFKGSFNPRWSTPEGVSAIWWAYNMDAAVLTTGLLIHIFAKHYGVWLRD